MNLNELKAHLEKVVAGGKASYAAKVRADPGVLADVYAYTSFLPAGIKLKTRIYRILRGLDMQPRCHHCGRPMGDRDIKSLEAGYRKYCCLRCAEDSEERKRLYSETCARLFGAENASSSAAVKKKRADTNVDKFGVDNPAKSKRVIEKIKRTNLKKYGCECALHSKEVAEKTAATNVERYGVSSYSKTEEFAKKVASRNLERFGVEYPNKDPEFRKKARKRYAYKNMKFDSAPELAFFIYAEDNGIDVALHPDVKFEYRARGKTYSYQPDFKVGDEYVELKGLQFFENRDKGGKMINPYDRAQDDVYEDKRQCMTANGVEILSTEDYAPYVRYVESRYGKGYLKGFKSE